MASSRQRKNEPNVEALHIAPKGDRLHSATYASDNRNPGKYLIRVVGPNAAKFAAREVPVTMRNGDEHSEKLIKAIWAGVDIGTDAQPGTNQPVALYTFEAKPREDLNDDIPF